MNYDLVISYVQQVTEMMPVSSSTQVYVLGLVLGIHVLFPEYLDFFLHGPTIGVLSIYFYPRWRAMRWLFDSRIRGRVWSLMVPVVTGVCASLGGMSIGYVAIKVYQPMVTLVHTYYVWWVIGGQCVTLAALLSLKTAPVGEIARKVSWRDGLLVGFVQGAALLPGISRFAITYAVLRQMRYTSRHAFEASFLFIVPFLGAAFVKGALTMYAIRAYSFLSGGLLASFVIGSALAYGMLCVVGRMVERRVLWWWSGYVVIILSMLIYRAVLINP